MSAEKKTKGQEILGFISLLLSVVPFVPNVSALVEEFKAVMRPHADCTDEEWAAKVGANEGKFASWQEWAGPDPPPGA